MCRPAALGWSTRPGRRRQGRRRHLVRDFVRLGPEVGPEVGTKIPLRTARFPLSLCVYAVAALRTPTCMLSASLAFGRIGWRAALGESRRWCRASVPGKQDKKSFGSATTNSAGCTASLPTPSSSRPTACPERPSWAKTRRYTYVVVELVDTRPEEPPIPASSEVQQLPNGCPTLLESCNRSRTSAPFDQRRPFWATCWPPWSNFGEQTQRPIWPMLADLDQSLVDVDQLWPKLSQHCSSFAPILPTSTHTGCKSAKLGQIGRRSCADIGQHVAQSCQSWWIWAYSRLPGHIFGNCWTLVRQLLERFGARRDRHEQLVGMCVDQVL